MKVLLMTLNAKFIHKNLAIRYLYTTKPQDVICDIKEYTIKDSVERIAAELADLAYDIIGMSTYIWNVQPMKELAEAIIRLRPTQRLVIGGPEVSFDPAYFLDTWPIEAVICGEGEFVFWQYVCQTVQKETIAGVFTRKSKPHVAYALADIDQLEQYELPYFLDMDAMQMAQRYFYVETSRGCPYRCSYCLSSVQSHVRLFSLSHIKKILDKLFQSDVRQIKFLDRTFNVDQHRAVEIASYILTHAKKEQSFQFEIMAEHIGDALLEVLTQKPSFPLFRYEIGIQTTNQRSLHAIHRVQNMERLQAVILRLQHGGNSEQHVDLIAGLPYETLASFRNSFHTVYCLQADEVQLGFLKLLRGTVLRKEYARYGMQYDSLAPYEVSKTAWMSAKDMSVIHDVCFALDALYNKKRMCYMLHAVGKEAQVHSFDLFAKLGKELRAHKYKQLDTLFHDVYALLRDESYGDKMRGWLSVDYYRLFNQRPKRFAPFDMKQPDKEAVNKALHQFGIEQNTLDNYTMLDEAYMEESGYLCALYSRQQVKPRLFFIAKKHWKVKEI